MRRVHLRRRCLLRRGVRCSHVAWGASPRWRSLCIRVVPMSRPIRIAAHPRRPRRHGRGEPRRRRHRLSRAVLEVVCRQSLAVPVDQRLNDNFAPKTRADNSRLSPGAPLDDSDAGARLEARRLTAHGTWRSLCCTHARAVGVASSHCASSHAHGACWAH